MKNAPWIWSSICMALFLEGCLFSAPKYKGPNSDHFDGARFHNQVGNERGLGDVAKWLATRKPGAWSNNHPTPNFVAPPARVNDESIRVTFVNHATVLIQVNGLNILTDPIWSERCSPLSFIGPKRVRAPGVRFEDLPPIDVVLISHNHYDHLDIPTLKKLSQIHRPRIFAGLGNQVYLEGEGIQNAFDIDWWQSVDLGNGMALIGVPAQHFSGRGLVDRNATLWMGFIVKSPQGNVFFAGDTGLGPHFADIKKRVGAVKVSLLPVGAFQPNWMMGPVHMSPSEAVQAAQILESPHNIGIHFGTFKLADDGEDEPRQELTKALASLKKPLHFDMLDFGEWRHF